MSVSQWLAVLAVVFGLGGLVQAVWREFSFSAPKWRREPSPRRRALAFLKTESLVSLGLAAVLGLAAFLVHPGAPDIEKAGVGAGGPPRSASASNSAQKADRPPARGWDREGRRPPGEEWPGGGAGTDSGGGASERERGRPSSKPQQEVASVAAENGRRGPGARDGGSGRSPVGGVVRSGPRGPRGTRGPRGPRGLRAVRAPRGGSSPSRRRPSGGGGGDSPSLTSELPLGEETCRRVAALLRCP